MWPPFVDRLRHRGNRLRGWLVINTTDGNRITIGGLNGTGTSNVDLKLTIQSTDALGPFLRLVASFRMYKVYANFRRAGKP